MKPKVCRTCASAGSCTAHCQRVRDEVCSASQREWKQKGDRRMEKQLDEYSNEDSLYGWDLVTPADKVIFEKPLSRQESFLVMLLTAGKSRKEAQEMLGISKGSVDKMMSRIRAKTRKCQA